MTKKTKSLNIDEPIHAQVRVSAALERKPLGEHAGVLLVEALTVRDRKARKGRR